MDLTLGEAAKAAKRSKQALAAAIQKGRLSATKDANGVWHVDTSELLRVYPDATKPEVGDGGRDLAGLATTDNAEVAELAWSATHGSSKPSDCFWPCPPGKGICGP